MSNDKENNWEALETLADFQSLTDIAMDIRKTLVKRRLKASLKILQNSFTIIIVPAPESAKDDIEALKQVAASYLVTLKLPYSKGTTMGRCVFVDTDALIN